MTRSFLSPMWYRVERLKPRLRAHAAIHRQHYRGDLWYVLQDRTSGRFHRFSPEAYRIIAMMNGHRTLDEIWETTAAQLPDDAVTQDEVIQLLGRLHSADVLHGDVPPDITELSDRTRRDRKRKVLMGMLNPLALRVPVLDPDNFLSATLPLVRPIISWFGALLLLGVASYSLFLVGLHWDELTENVIDRVLSSGNLVLLLLAYPMVKLFHELGHAYAIKRWGGHVHEVGVMLLVFMPVPYVDASDSLAFRSKWQRAFVASAGILVELFLAAVAMVVWANAEEGLVRAFAFNVMLIGGVSTLLFNGNPLLRFDGYYVFSDLLEIPNLGPRANRYVGYLVQRYAFGINDAENPAEARGEPAWFVAYAVASFAYRIVITFAIVATIATRFFVIGVLLAIWSLVLMLLFPIAKQVWFLFTSPVLVRHRGRAFAVTGFALLALLAMLFAAPVPYNTVVEGVVATEAEAALVAGAEGVVSELLVESGDEVGPGTPIVRLVDPLLNAQLATIQAHISELRLRVQSEKMIDPAAERIYVQELSTAEAERQDAIARAEGLVVRARTAGRVILPGAADLIGRYVARGETIGHVVRFEDPLIRVAVPEAQAETVQTRTLGASIRFVADPYDIYPAQIERISPALTTLLPDPALASEGGGPVIMAPDPSGGRPRATTGLLVIDLRVAGTSAVATYGDHVFVRFSHGDEPIAERLYRAGMQVFLRFYNT